MEILIGKIICFSMVLFYTFIIPEEKIIILAFLGNLILYFESELMTIYKHATLNFFIKPYVVKLTQQKDCIQQIVPKIVQSNFF